MAELLEGLVIAHLGQGLAVEADDVLYLCQTKRKLDTCAVGDKVLLEIAGPEQGRVTEILPVGAPRGERQNPPGRRQHRPGAGGVCLRTARRLAAGRPVSGGVRKPRHRRGIGVE